MVRKQDQDHVRELLTEAITVLCRNGLGFKSELNIEALIGITLDKDDVFLVSIKETVHGKGGNKQSSSLEISCEENNESASTQMPSLSPKLLPESAKKRGRVRKRKQSNGEVSIDYTPGKTPPMPHLSACLEPAAKRQTGEGDVEGSGGLTEAEIPGSKDSDEEMEEEESSDEELQQTPQLTKVIYQYKTCFCFLSPPVLMQGGLLCIAFCLSVCL